MTIRKSSIPVVFLKNGPTPASFIIYFQSFQTNIITILTTIICEKITSSIRCWDSNPRPLEHEPPAITTRPGLQMIIFVAFQKTRHHEAEQWFRKAVTIAPNDANVHLQFGFFLLDTERNLEAAMEVKKRLQIYCYLYYFQS